MTDINIIYDSENSNYIVKSCNNNLYLQIDHAFYGKNDIDYFSEIDNISVSNIKSIEKEIISLCKPYMVKNSNYGFKSMVKNNTIFLDSKDCKKILDKNYDQINKDKLKLNSVYKIIFSIPTVNIDNINNKIILNKKLYLVIET